MHSSILQQSAGLRENIFYALSPVTLALADLYVMGADYEMNGLASGLNYFVRVKAENAAGACASSMQFIPDCGAFIPTSPSAIVPRGAPAAPVALVASVLDVQSVRVNWTAPASIGAIVSYRVDAYTKSVKATAAESSFYGDNEVQRMMISHHSTHSYLPPTSPLMSTQLTSTVPIYPFTSTPPIQPSNHLNPTIHLTPTIYPPLLLCIHSPTHPLIRPLICPHRCNYFPRWAVA